MDEYEIVKHTQIEDLNIFVVEMTYRCPHMHREFEICLMLSGEVRINVNGRNETFGRGELMIFNPRQTHEIHTVTENAVMLSIQVASGFFRRLWPDIMGVEFENTAVRADESDLRDICSMAIDLGLVYLKREPLYEFFCMSLVSEIFGRMLLAGGWHLLTEKEKNEQYARSRRISNILNYIENHYTEKLLLTDVAESENLSVYYLSHMFKEILGISFQEYVALRRFERARKMVENSDRSITEISLECGFSDYRYLNKVYQKQLGYTPSEYRKTHRYSGDYVVEHSNPNDTQTFLSVNDSIELLEIARIRYANNKII